MKKLLVFILLLISALTCRSQGLPYVINFSEDDYNAHSRNFDITIDSAGVVWVANFEGLVYFDNSKWRTIHIPGFARATVAFSDDNGAVWVGGYNFFGKVEIKENGEPYIRQIDGAEHYQGEIQEIWQSDGKIKFLASNGNICYVEDGRAVLEKNISSEIVTGLSDVVDYKKAEKEGVVEILDDEIVTLSLDSTYGARLVSNKGIEILDSAQNILYTLSEDNYLANNNISYIAYGKGVLWGAGEKSIFAVRVPSRYSFFDTRNGLNGSIEDIKKHDGKIYAATLNGLYVLDGRRFTKLKDFPHACWSLAEVGGMLYCATPDGVFALDGRQMSSTSALSLKKIDENSFIAGCVDGVYLFQIKEKNSTKICPLEKVTVIKEDDAGTIYLQSLYGHIWKREKNTTGFRPLDLNPQSQNAVAIVDGQALIVSDKDKYPIEYPMFSHYDYDGISWLTDYTGRNLYRWRGGRRLDDRLTVLHPVRDMAVSALYKEEGKIWLGSDDGITVIDLRANDPAFSEKPSVKIRNVIVGDSVVWGGFGVMPADLGVFEHYQRKFKFEFSLDGFLPAINRPLYRYRLNGGAWSSYADDFNADFLNMTYGQYEFEVQGKTIYGVETEPVKIRFKIKYPFYMRWYAVLFYIVVFALMVFAMFRMRIRRLKQDKIKLEKIIDERTAEVVRQKDEIETKSQTLEEALQELSSTQDELIRQEKMATVGKLTQGLIDRILNPLNYINNFSKLSENLVKDIEANIEDEKENMDEENYEDTLDVLSMLKGNLEKVGQHGQNTTRTLKAMEEMLKDRSGGMIKTDLRSILKKNEEVVSKYHEKCIHDYGIKVTFVLPEVGMPFDGNPELLSKTFMSIINNGFYAVVKKSERQRYDAEVRVEALFEQDKYLIKFYDNGIGIEETILDKVFDPFFTTKPTGEASGVGLYLSREIIQNHHGDISVRSKKDEFTELTVEFRF